MSYEKGMNQGYDELVANLKYPPALAKACVDHFAYAVRLRTGEIYEFQEAEAINCDWVRIKEFDNPIGLNGIIFDRGLEIKISEIVWVCDAPRGS